jgi:cephalosporin-C deacetylase-like acetyl esterase
MPLGICRGEERYAPVLDEPADSDDFRAQKLAETRAHEFDLRLGPADTMLTAVRSCDVTSAGSAVTPVGHRSSRARSRVCRGKR